MGIYSFLVSNLMILHSKGKNMFSIYFTEHNDPKFSGYTLSKPNGTKAVIYPNLGASLQELYFENKPIIQNIFFENNSPKLLNSSCSAILFPFANRIKNGQYFYNNEVYQLDCNETARGHAMHGLVYTQPFQLKESTSNTDTAKIVFQYEYKGDAIGFPFPFKITLTYLLKNSGLQLSVHTQNTGNKTFPFSLGWHPYFWSSDLDKSEVHLHSEERIITDEKMIPTRKDNHVFPNPLLLANQNFDDAFVLRNNVIAYKTPDYHIHLQTTPSESPQYVQLYTPSHRQSIAIEPMTAAADCFNNKMGLQELKPSASYSTEWQLEMV